MEALDATYLRVLDELPGLVGYKLVMPRRTDDAPRLKLRTKAGKLELAVQLYRSHLSHRTADHVAAAAKNSDRAVLVVAPHIGANLAAKFADAGLNYLDANGNCHIDAPPLFIHVEGKRGTPIARADKGIRSAGYQVLFAYLAEPSLLDATVRAVAEFAGVSRQPVSDMKRRLIEDEYVFATKTTVKWHPRRVNDALSLWLHGYKTVVRPALLWDSYRTKATDPDELEQRIAELFGQDESSFRWGGNAAGYRMTGHFRGERAVIHVDHHPAKLAKRLPAAPDRRGNLVFLDAFGSINWEGHGDTVHPLLVYSEILDDGSERAREAAQELYEHHLEPIWEGK